MLVQIETRLNRDVQDAVVAVAVLDESDQLIYETDTSAGDAEVQGREGDKLRVRFELQALPLVPGPYHIIVGVHPSHRSVLHDLHDERYGFDVTEDVHVRGRMYVSTNVRVERL